MIGMGVAIDESDNLQRMCFQERLVAFSINQWINKNAFARFFRTNQIRGASRMLSDELVKDELIAQILLCSSREILRKRTNIYFHFSVVSWKFILQIQKASTL